MAKRRHLTLEESLAAAEAIQIALLEGIARARRWAKAELAFQGGTCLHLAYGSPRASEDLDFIVASDKGLGAVMEAAVAHARSYVRQTIGPDAELDLKARGVDSRTGAERNPRMFTVSFRAAQFLESVRIRVEFWIATPEAASGYDSEPRIVRLSQDAQTRRPIKLSVSQAIIPSARLTEIFADKIHAMAGRDYLKLRDVFDLWWLDQQAATLDGERLRAALENRRALYPNGPRLDADWANRLRMRAEEMLQPANLAALSKDLRHWLALSPDSIAPQPENTRAIAEVAAACVLDAANVVDPQDGA